MKFQRMDNPKCFDIEIQFIKFFECLRNESVEITGYPKVLASISKEGKNVELTLNDGNVISEEDENNESVVLKLNGKDYLIENLNFKSAHTKIQQEVGVGFENKFSIHSFCSIAFDKKSESTFKTFFPVKKDKIIDFYNQFETVTYQRNGTEYAYDCISFNADGIRFDITKFKTEDEGYCVIECLCGLSFEEFRRYCFAIQIGLGFISGKMLGGEEYSFNKTKSIYYSNYIRPEIKSMYVPIHTNPYSRLYNQTEIAQFYFNKLTHIKPEQFSNLITEILKSSKFSSSIILLLEASSIRSLLLIPTVFSVIIESLSSIILVPEVGKELPINEPNLKKKVTDELLEVINNNSLSIGSNGSLKLSNRIRSINKPIIKEHLTNLEKLIQPFEQLGITLNAKDWEVIEHRNDLLHGNILLDIQDDGRSSREKDAYMNYVGSRLYTLISKLILKYIGYDGYIYNHSKFNEVFIGINSDEEYFELI